MGDALKRPRKRQLNSWASYFEGTGCVKLGNGAVIELTVAEEELFELLLCTPKITVPWDRITYELARSQQTVRHLMKGLRNKLGSRAIRTHTGHGISLQPHFIGTSRFALSQKDRPLGHAQQCGAAPTAATPKAAAD